MPMIVVLWTTVAILLIFIGVMLIIASIKARFSLIWKLLLSLIGILTIGIGLYWCLFLVGIAIP